MKVDLGCGLRKYKGFIGIDRFPLPGVDIVHDLDNGIPLEDNSVELMVASHSLEHVGDLMFTMEEIYRVCKHMAVLCIIAPYAHTSINLANPYHKHMFNEDTPRFFTKSPVYRVDPAEVYYPGIYQWGLAHSDHSDPKMDFRCMHMEIFHFHPYNTLAENEKRTCRRSYINVAHTIFYCLVAVKEPIVEEELDAFSEQALVVPPLIASYREMEKSGQLY